MCNHERRVGPPSGRQTDPIADELPTPVSDIPISRLAQQVQRRDACATAVADDRERIAEGLYDSVIHRLFAAGLQLQATCQVVDSPTQARIETTIDLLDDTITELRKAIFSLR